MFKTDYLTVHDISRTLNVYLLSNIPVLRKLHVEDCDVVTDIRARIGKASGVLETQQHWHEHQITSLHLNCPTYCHMPERPGQLWPRLGTCWMCLTGDVCEIFSAFRGKITSATRTC